MWARKHGSNLSACHERMPGRMDECNRIAFQPSISPFSSFLSPERCIFIAVRTYERIRVLIKISTYIPTYLPTYLPTYMHTYIAWGMTAAHYLWGLHSIHSEARESDLAQDMSSLSTILPEHDGCAYIHTYSYQPKHSWQSSTKIPPNVNVSPFAWIGYVDA
jgi:hypothetical protein